MIESLPAFLSYWSNARARTARVLDHLPASELEWSYAPGRFTFGDLFRHLAAIERFMYAENVAGRPSRYPGHAVALAPGIDNVREYLTRCHQESLAIFRELTDDALHGQCHTVAGAPITVWKWLRAMTEHEAHHRGQLYLMASMRGIAIPPLFGLTEEEVFARSTPPI
ncbi:MAG: DinB family protein [Gemmatimonadaceae bacterium]|nr:DinB family protein [Gemmatimonadaceae bacterium]